MGQRNRAKELAKAMSEKTELGEVFLGASYVDELLGELIQTRCVDHEATREMFNSDDPDRPFNFSSKAKLASCLGLISREELDHAKHLMRTRNKLAHETVAGLFESKKYQKILSKRFPKSANHEMAHKNNVAEMKIIALLLTATFARRLEKGSHGSRPQEYRAHPSERGNL